MMAAQAFEGDIVALQTALAALGISKGYAEISREICRPFLLTGSAEWLDRSILQLYPRMKTELPDELLEFRLREYSQLRHYGVRFTGAWCRDSTLISQFVTAQAGEKSVYMLLCHTDQAIPVLSHTADYLASLSAPTKSWHAEIAAIPAPNGFLVIRVTRDVPLPLPPPFAHIGRARALLEAHTIFRFSTPTHPIRVYQAWHLGHASLEVIAIAAQEAAPLAIVSDTVAQVFATFHARALLAFGQIEDWQLRDENTLQNSDIYDAIKSKYLDVIYLFELACTQFPLGLPVRALTRAEGALIAEVCRDTRFVCVDVCRDMELIVG